MPGGLNPVDEELQQQSGGPAPTLDPIDDAIARVRTGETFATRRTLLQAGGTNPDQAAEARKLALRYGAPVDEVTRNLDQFRQRAAGDRPYDAIQAQTPHLAGWLQQPENAAIAHDDLEKLGLLEWLTTAPVRAWNRGVAQVEFGQLAAAQITRDLTGDERKRLEQLRAQMQEGGELGAAQSWFRQAVTGAAQQLPMTFGAFLAGAKYGVPAGVAAGTGAALLGQAGPQIAIPEEIVTVPAAFGAAFRYGAMFGGAKFAGELEAGMALDEYQQFRDEQGNKLDPRAAKAAALAAGVLNGGLEVVGLEKLAERIPGVDKLTGAIGRGAVRQALKNPSIRSALTELVKGYGETLTAETAVEVAQRAVTILSGELAKVGSGSSIPLRTPSDVAGDLKNELVQDAIAFTLISAPGPLMQFGQHVRMAQRAQQNVAFFNALGEGVRDSKAAQRAPEAVRELLQRSTEGGPIANVYAPTDSWTAYWQSKGLDPAAVAAEVTGDRGALEQAIDEGRDLKIPTSRYATTIAGSEHGAFFAQELRLQPDEMNAREATAFLETAKQAAEAQQLEARPETAREQIRSQLVQKLETAQVPRQTAEAYANLVEAGVGTLAEAAGLNPVDVFNRYGLEVQRRTEAEGAATQAAAAPGGTTEPIPGVDVAPAAPENAPALGVNGEGVAPAEATNATAKQQTPGAGGSSAAPGATGLEGEVPGLAELVASLGGAQLEERGTEAAAVNASGESAASAEALSRQLGMRTRGERFVVFDRAGNRRPLIGPEAVDYTPRRGETYGVEGPGGFRVLEDRGGRYTSERQANETGQAGGTGDAPRPLVSDRARELAAAHGERTERGAGDQRGNEPRRLPAPQDYPLEPFQRATPEADAARLSEGVRQELQRIADELDQFPFVERTWSYVEDKSGNAAGGDANIVAGAAGAPVYNDVLDWSPLNKGRGGEQLAKTVRGTRGQVEAAIRKTLETGRIESNLAEGAVRVAERRDAGDYRYIGAPMLPASWGVEAPAGFVDDVREALRAEVQAEQEQADAVDTGEGDTSFNVSEFGQSLFDLFEEKPADVATQEAIDVLETGEQQPRLPVAGDVREQEIATPEFEAPFALTPPKGETGRRGKQTTLFQPQPGPMGARNADGVAAHFLGWQERAGGKPPLALYNVDGGPFHRSTVTTQRLEAEGIPIPPTPEPPASFAQGDSAKGRRGAITFGPDRRFTITLFERADLSTFLHETGHFFLEVFSDLVEQVGASDPTQLTDQQRTLLRDYGALLSALGVENRREIGTAQHEQFAQMFEAYLMEGRAPSLELRSTFAKFRAWLIGIYRHLQALGAPMTEEVRGIFDRMLASEEAIRAQEDAGRFSPMFLTPEAAGMTPERFELYRAQIADASRAARENLDRKLAAEVQAERTREYKARRVEVEAEVRAQAEAAPVYRAIAAIRRGTNPDGSPLIEGETTEPLKLSRAMIVDAFGAERLKELPPGTYSREGGLDPEAVAQRFGFGSGDELLRSLATAPKLADAIKAETDRRMLEEHGSMLLDGTLPLEASAAMANDVRDGVVRAELRALYDLQRTTRPFEALARREERGEREYERRWLEAEARLRIAIAEGYKQAEIDKLEAEVQELKARARGGAAEVRRLSSGIPSRQTLAAVAEERIARTRILDLNPSEFFAASRRAAQQALERAARQDFSGAIQAKTQELTNLALYREAEKARDEVDTRVRRIRDLSKGSTRAMLGIAGDAYTDQIDGILDRYEFSRVSNKVLERRAAVSRFVAGLEAEGLPVDLPDEVLNDARRINYRQISVEEFRGVADGIDQIVHLARLKTRLLKAAEARELNAVAADVSTSIRDNARGRRREEPRDRRPSNERRRTVGDFFGSHRKLASVLREMDGFQDGGAAWSAIMQPLNEAGARESTMMADATHRFAEIVERAFPGAEKRSLYTRTLVPAVGRAMSRMERIMVAMNWGNEGNRDRIRRAEGWDDAQVQSVLDTLAPSDLRFVQDVFDFLESFRPAIAEKQKRVYGVEPTWVEATPFTARGGDVRGGYFPLRYDDRLSAGAIAKLDLEAANLARQAAYAQATTKRGHTKERAASVKMPVRLDFGVMFEHVDQVIHDLTHHEALIDVGRLLGHRDVQTAILEHYGDQVYKMIRGTVRDVAFGDVPAVNGFEKALNHVRAGATIAGLGWNLSTALLQPLGLSNSIVRIGPTWVARGLARWLRNPTTIVETVHWIEGRSEFMAARGRSFNREINEIRNRVGVETGTLSGWVDEALAHVPGHVTRQGIADSYFWMIQQMQAVADVPTWLGQYEKSMAAGETEERAIALADQAVLDSQGGGQIKDLATVQRGGPMMRLWTNFYSFFNVLYNQAVESAKRTNYRHPAEVGRMASDYMMLFVVPATLGYLIRHAMKPRKEGEKPEDVATDLFWENVSYPAGMMLGVREVSGALQGSFGYEGPAGARAFASLARLGQQVRQGDTDAAFWRALNDVGGVIFHYPAGQMTRTINGIAALAEGRTKNPGALIAGAPPAK